MSDVVVTNTGVSEPPHGAGGGGSGLPPFRYNAQLATSIESGWQDRWEAEGTFNTPNPVGPLSDGFEAVKDQPKLFVMDMFPYPSGAGLHVGHPLGFIGTDVFSRFKRMTGHNVLHTMGFDAFGLPAEQYAMQTGTHPRSTTEANIATYRRQLRQLGLGHDKRRSVSTTDTEFRFRSTLRFGSFDFHQARRATCYRLENGSRIFFLIKQSKLKVRD